jgi:hypothetical protein
MSRADPSFIFILSIHTQYEWGRIFICDMVKWQDSYGFNIPEQYIILPAGATHDKTSAETTKTGKHF